MTEEARLATYALAEFRENQHDALTALNSGEFDAIKLINGNNDVCQAWVLPARQVPDSVRHIYENERALALT